MQRIGNEIARRAHPITVAGERSFGIEHAVILKAAVMLAYWMGRGMS
ncbi:hypothetical protein [Pyruvatibacter mobilis]